MTLVPVTPPEPIVTASQARAMVPSLADSSDGQVNAWLAAATALIDGSAGWLGRAIGEQTWDLKVDYDDWWTQAGRYSEGWIRIPLPPLRSVDAVTYKDSDGTTELPWASSNYLVRGVNGLTGGKLFLAYGSVWPTVQVIPEAMTIRFSAGWAQEDVPRPIVQAILLMAGDMQTSSAGTSGGVQSRSIEGLGSETYARPTSLEDNRAVAALLSPFRVFW